MYETRILVCGSRFWSDRDLIREKLAWFYEPEAHVVVVHGCAKGADTIAGEEAARLGFEVEEHPAVWSAYGRRAGIVRNEEMAALGATRLLAFWDGRSRGTRDMIERAKAHGIPVTIVYEE